MVCEIPPHDHRAQNAQNRVSIAAPQEHDHTGVATSLRVPVMSETSFRRPPSQTGQARASIPRVHAKNDTIRKILTAVDLPTEPPRAAPARPPPQESLELS